MKFPLSWLLALATCLAGCSAGSDLPDSTRSAGAPKGPRAAAPAHAISRDVLASARGVHMAMNTGAGAEAAMRRAVGTALHRGGTATATRTTVQVSRGSFTDETGRVRTNEIAAVRLEGVTLSNGARLNSAGFWFGRSVDDGTVFLQWRPGIDSNLNGVTGFSQDVYVGLGPDGNVSLPADTVASGDALQLVADVIASAPALLGAAEVQVSAPATLDRDQLVTGTQRIGSAVQASRDVYFNELRQLNVQWLGISVSMFVDNVGDPQIRQRYRSSGADEFEIATWDDTTLAAFIARAREQGFKVYLTLAFEQPRGDDSVMIPASDPRCMTPQAPLSRWVMGQEQLANGDMLVQCVNRSDYWWNPSHPEHAAKRAIFWQSYTATAVKYAQLAQQTGVELYSLGTETEWLFRARPGGGMTSHFGAELAHMVSMVRASYSGRVTYDQHIKIHTQPQMFGGGEWGPALAADLGLDVIGLSAYVDAWPTMPDSVIPVADLQRVVWEPVFAKLAALKAANPGRPIVFTEIGVTNDLGAPYNQGSRVGAAAPAGTETDGMRQQANMYTAMFNANAAYGYPMVGAFFWSRYMTNGMAAGACAVITHDIACSPPARQAIAAGYTAMQQWEAQRVFDWAESVYGGFFPGAPSSGEFAGYTYRFYPASGNYLGYRDGSIYVHNGQDWNVLNVGPVSAFIETAAASGF